MKKIIHVDQFTIKRNRKNGTNDPPISVQTYKGVTKAQSVTILGSSVIKHSPHKPLKCGARVWIETNSTVIIDDGSPLSNWID